MKRSLLLIATLSLAGCGHYRTEREETNLANSAATIYEAALAIRSGADPTGPLLVILANSKAIAGAVDHPYPPPPKGTP